MSRGYMYNLNGNKWKRECIMDSNKEMRIIFVYQVASFWPSWDSLYQQCVSDPMILVKVFRIDGSEGDEAQMNNSDLFLKKKGISYEEFDYQKVMEFKPHYMIYQTPYDKGHRPISTWTARFKREGIKIIYIPYGIEISDTAESQYKHFSLSVVLNAFSVFVLSDEIKKEYISHCINHHAVKPLGLPRFDSLAENREIPEEYRDRINGRKVILWKTHFPKIFVENGIKKQATPSLDEYLSFLHYIDERQDLFFVFMPHPKFADLTIDEELLPKAKHLIDELCDRDNVFIDNSEDYRNSLVNADAIIVDRSAIMVEAGTKNVPVLYMHNAEFTEPMTKPIQDLLDSYYQGTTAGEMEAFCEMVRKGQDDKAEVRKRAFSKCVPYVDGKCAFRIKNRLFEDLGNQYNNNMIRGIPENSSVVFFGAGELSGYILRYTSDVNKLVKIVGFVDNNRKRWGKQFYGYMIHSPQDLKYLEYDFLVIATDRYFEQVYHQIQELGIQNEKVMNYDLYMVLMNY